MYVNSGTLCQDPNEAIQFEEEKQCAQESAIEVVAIEVVLSHISV